MNWNQVKEFKYFFNNFRENLVDMPSLNLTTLWRPFKPSQCSMNKVCLTEKWLYVLTNLQVCYLNFLQDFKVEKILEGCLDLIPSPSLSVKIQIMGTKVCLRCKCKTLLFSKVCWHRPAMFCLITSSKR